MPYVISNDHATHTINTVYVVFLGIIFTSLFKITDLPSGVSVSCVFSRTSPTSTLLCLTLLVYFVFDWAIWQALLSPSRSVSDWGLFGNIAGVVTLGLAFNFGLNLSAGSVPITYPMFAVYALTNLRDDIVLVVRYHNLANLNQTPASALGQMVLFAYVPLVVKFGFVAALIIFSIILAIFPRNAQDFRDPLIMILAGIVVFYTLIKGCQYIVLRRCAEDPVWEKFVS